MRKCMHICTCVCLQFFCEFAVVEHPSPRAMTPLSRFIPFSKFIYTGTGTGTGTDTDTDTDTDIDTAKGFG